MLIEQAQLKDDLIQLKLLSTSDTKALYKMRTDPDLCRKAGLTVFTHISQSYTFITNVSRKVKAREFYYWGIYANDNLVGVISLWALDYLEKSGELGYFISSDYLRKGYMYSAIKLVVNFVLIQTELSSVVAYIEADNTASINLVKKIGFEKFDESFEEDMADNFVKMYQYRITELIK